MTVKKTHSPNLRELTQDELHSIEGGFSIKGAWRSVRRTVEKGINTAKDVHIVFFGDKIGKRIQY